MRLSFLRFYFQRCRERRCCHALPPALLRFFISPDAATLLPPQAIFAPPILFTPDMIRRH